MKNNENNNGFFVKLKVYRLGEVWKLSKTKKNEDYLLTGGLEEKRMTLLEKVIAMDEGKLGKIKGVIMKNAREQGRSCEEIVLRDAQVKPVLMSYINPRFFIGDKPGLGKTVMSAGSYAYYAVQQRKKGLKPKKVIVVTENTHVIGFANEWNRYGIKLLPLTKSSTGIERAFRNNNWEEFDGVITNWDGLKTNGFLEHYLVHSEEYGYGVFDETSKLLNPTSAMYKTVDAIVNKYKGGLERVIFLNGSSIEKDLFDFYYQFNILKPKLIPSKSFLEGRYIVRGGRNVYMKDLVHRGSNTQIETVQRRIGEIVDYQNHDELRDRLRYYYMARTKEDYGGDVPVHSYILHGVAMTGKQKKILDEKKNISLINSPKTNDPNEKFTFTTSPKLKEIVEFADKVSEDRPIIYVYNKEAQYTIAEELRKLGYRVEVLNGDAGTPEEKDKIIDKFNTKKLDMLVLNIRRAINIPTSDRVIFYDIPMIPQHTTQIRGRIDRNNYDTKKFYDFFCYLDSPEMVNIVRLAYFREHHGSKFTGQKENVYEMLVSQLRDIYVDGEIEGIEEAFERMEVEGRDFKDIQEEVEDLLNI